MPRVTAEILVPRLPSIVEAGAKRRRLHMDCGKCYRGRRRERIRGRLADGIAETFDRVISSAADLVARHCAAFTGTGDRLPPG